MRKISRAVTRPKKRKVTRWLRLIGLLMICTVFAVGLAVLIDRFSEAQGLPETVTKWRPDVATEMAKQGLDSQWLDIMMAQLMQESGGRHVDIFQCSESKYGVPGLIQSEAESIEQAVYYWTLLLSRAQELNLPTSKENILQSYNMGIGYLDYLVHHESDTTEELAARFSLEVLNGGGDPYYVNHVLRYVP